MSFCENCVKSVTHEGTPEGSIETLGGVKAYVATPSDDYPKDKVLLFLPDIFGLELVNSKLLADDFARNGFKTVIPDYLNSDPYNPKAEGPKSEMSEWFKDHSSEVTRAPLNKVIDALKESGVTTFGATGYCLGGRYVFDLAFENIIKAAVVAHPSLLQVPADLEKYISDSKAPLLINSCTTDQMFPPEAQAKADEIYKSFEPGYKREYWEGCSHGFAVRGDLSDPKVKAGKEGAFKASVEWLIKHL